MNDNDTLGNLPQKSDGHSDRPRFSIIGVLLVAITPALLLILISCENTGRSAQSIAARTNVIDLDARRKASKQDNTDSDYESVATGQPQLYVLSDRKENSSAALAFSSRANSYSVCGEWRKALGDYLMAASIDPTSERYSNCAQMYTKLGDYDNAINFFARAITTKPEKSDLEITYTTLEHSPTEEL
jgi:tetratricopeptide (TPR) repeat protein